MPFAAIQLVASGSVVQAVSGKKIRVVSAILADIGTHSWRFRSNQFDITGDLHSIPAPSFGSITFPLILPFNPSGWFETNVGESLNLFLGSGVRSISGCLTYKLI